MTIELSDYYIRKLQSAVNSVESEVVRQKSIYPKPESPLIWTSIMAEELGEVARAQLRGKGFEYRKELIQLAAVVVGAIVDYDSGFDVVAIKQR